MASFTTLINSKIGESRGVARVWLEGQKLIKAGVHIGSRYAVRRTRGQRRLELLPVRDGISGQVFTVSKRERNGTVVPLIEVRTQLIREVFDQVEKVRIVIRLGRIFITELERDRRVEERVQRATEKLRASKPLAVCSLFHGGGVLDRAIHTGLMRAGVDSFVQVGVELEAQYLDASLRNNSMLWNSESIAINSDIRDVARGPGFPQCDLLVAGIPCTGASRSGKAKNKLLATEDHPSAGGLFIDFLDFVRFCNPAIAVIENVPDYLSSTSMMVIRSVLQSLGYQLFECVMEGGQFGALENRARMAVVAYTPGLIDSLLLEEITPIRRKEPSLASVLDEVPDDDPRWKRYEYLRVKEERDLASGKNFHRQVLKSDAEQCGCLGRGYSKARSTEPFLCHPVDAGLSRLFTPTEHARLKTIPEDLVDGLSETVAHEVLGQSVVFAAFEALAATVGQKLRQAYPVISCAA